MSRNSVVVFSLVGVLLSQHRIQPSCAGQESQSKVAVTPKARALEAKDEHLTDDELLDLVQRQTWRYFYDFGHPDCGLARERSAPAKRGEKGLPGLSDIVTTGGTGFGLMAFPVAVERDWISRSQAVSRLRKIIAFLERVPRFHGMWAHWYDGSTGQVRPFSRKDDGGDLVESAFLFQGLLTVRQYFNGNSSAEKDLRKKITRLWHEADWEWYRNDNPWLLWHWSPNHGFEMNMPIMGFDEAMIVYVLAAASPTHPIDPALYHSGWAINANDRFADKGDYVQRLRIGRSNCGGPLFFTHYSFLGLSPYLRDRYVTAAGYRDYADHNRAMNLHCFQWCLAHGYPPNCWGLTSSDDPFQGYRAHSAKSGPRGDNGTITPTAALSSIVYTPAESMAMLRYLWANHRVGLWSDFGFRDAFHLKSGWYAPAHLAIDQGPIIAMIENHRSGLLWSLFMAIPEIQSAIEKLALQPTKTVAIPADVTREYYAIQGTNVSELVDAMRELQPNGHHASTSWDVQWRFRFNQNGEECQLTSFRSQGRIKIKLPRWEVPANAAPESQAQWQRYMDALMLHELGHADIGRNAVKTIQETIDGQTWVARDKKALAELIDKRCRAIVREYREKEIQYDKETNHGLTQGARLRLQR